MSLYDFHYEVCLEFGGEVKEHTFLLRCLPSDNNRQKILSRGLTVTPSAALLYGEDWAGNRTASGHIPQSHLCFRAVAEGKAETYADICEESGRSLSPVFRYPTRLTAAGEELQCFARELDLDKANPYETALAVCRAVYARLRYQKGATDARTTAEQAFRKGEGVCQDYAHCALALLRYYRIPCRYVAGILCGEGESHAWIEAECNGYLYGFDPTNNLLVSDGYLKFSGGRDAADCAVNRGVFKGVVAQRQTVFAEMTQCGEA